VSLRNDDSHSGPFQVEVSVNVPPVVRATGCVFRKDCLDFAAKSMWSNFTCAGCNELSGGALLPLFDSEENSHVSLSTFLRRVDECYKDCGYSEEHFYDRILHEVYYYYGRHSVEYRYMTLQVDVLGAALGEVDGDAVEMNHLCVEMRKQNRTLPDFCKMYFNLFGKRWLTRTH